MIAPIEIIKLAIVLSLAVTSTIQDFADDACQGATTWKHSKEVSVAVEGETETKFMVKASCVKDVLSYITDCDISDPKVHLKASKDGETGAPFFFKDKFYVLHCPKTARPKVKVMADAEFSFWVFSTGDDANYKSEIPVEGADNGVTTTVYFKQVQSSKSWNIAKCLALGPTTEGADADKTGIFVKGATTYEIKCNKDAAPKILKKANFVNEICKENNKKAEVEVAGSGGYLKAMCVSFYCKSNTEIAKCTRDCKTFGGGVDAGKTETFSKNDKKYEFTCSSSGAPAITFKGQ